MQHHPISNAVIRHSMRSCSADFFTMPVAKAANRNPPPDRHPIRRSLQHAQGFEAWVGNEHMSPALWQLLVRS